MQKKNNNTGQLPKAQASHRSNLTPRTPSYIGLVFLVLICSVYSDIDPARAKMSSAEEAKDKDATKGKNDFVKNDIMQMAEKEPEEFLEMLRKRLLIDLINEKDKSSYTSIAKYESFVKKIPQEQTRLDAQAMLKELKENYSKTWHLLYPIRLSERWHEIKGNPKAREDFAEILKIAGVTACREEHIPKSLEPVSKIKLYGPVNYLDPLDEAVEKLSNTVSLDYKFKNTRVTSFNRVEFAGMPLDTFYYYSYDVVSQTDSVNRLYIMVDSYKRVVAVQEVIDSPKMRRLTEHSSSRSVYNFMQGRRKGTPSYAISYSLHSLVRNPETGYYKMDYNSTADKNVCVLTSELIDRRAVPREWVRLYLPLRLAELCLYICEEVDE